jgi:ABC-type transport system substrate-binding protein
VGVKAKIVSYEWGEYLSGMRKGEHDSALFGWMSDGDPDNFADVLLGCNSIKTGSNAARWCDKGYDSLVQKAKLTSNPAERANSTARRRRFSTSRRRGLRWQTGKRSMPPAATSRGTA